MKRPSLLFICPAAFALALIGCQVLASLEKRTVDPPPAAGCSLPGVGSAPSTGNGRIRLVNVGAQGGNADFCIRKSGSSDWGRPLLRNGGTEDGGSGASSGLCTAGLAYEQATVPFSVPTGKIDVKAIPAGKTCAAAATSEKDGVTVGDSVTGASPAGATTIIRYAGGSSTEQMTALLEEPGAQNPAADRLRVVNVLGDGKPISFGPAAGEALPTTVAGQLFTVPPGGIAPPGPAQIGTVDAEGYLQVLDSLAFFGASLVDDQANKAIVVTSIPDAPDTASLFVFGDSADRLHPVRGLYCEQYLSALQAANTGAAQAPADAALLDACVLTKLSTISIDTWDVGLYGLSAKFELDRRPAIAPAIQARTSDLFCIVEVADQGLDRDPIIQAAIAQYPYSYEIATTPTTPADDPTTANGSPPAPPTIPCGGSVNGGAVAADYHCMEDHCSTALNDKGVGAGYLAATTDCISKNCFGIFASLYSDPPQTPEQLANDACHDCILLHVTSGLETFATQQQACTTQAQYPFAFAGQTPIVMLSHYPFVPGSKKSYILPSYGFNRAVLKAQVQLEDQQVDFFCAMVISPNLDSTLPYAGPYGQSRPSTDGGPSENGWQNQQDLQAKRAVAWIQSEADKDKLPAIIAGMWYSTVGSSDPDAGANVLASVSPEVMEMVDQSANPQAPFTRAEPPGYTRACDYCPSNAYNTGAAPAEYAPLFLYNFPPSSTTAETIWATDNAAVSIQLPAGQVGKGPLSMFYAHNTEVLRPE